MSDIGVHAANLLVGTFLKRGNHRDIRAAFLHRDFRGKREIQRRAIEHAVVGAIGSDRRIHRDGRDLSALGDDAVKLLAIHQRKIIELASRRINGNDIAFAPGESTVIGNRGFHLGDGRLE